MYRVPAGRELVWLAEALPDREIVGIDLAEGMVEAAQQRLAAAQLGCAPLHTAYLGRQQWLLTPLPPPVALAWCVLALMVFVGKLAERGSRRKLGTLASWPRRMAAPRASCRASGCSRCRSRTVCWRIGTMPCSLARTGLSRCCCSRSLAARQTACVGCFDSDAGAHYRCQRLISLDRGHAGGVMAVMFWEPPVEEAGPWHRLASLTTGHAVPVRAVD